MATLGRTDEIRKQIIVCFQRPVNYDCYIMAYHNGWGMRKGAGAWGGGVGGKDTIKPQVSSGV